jgi:hypothetical protein
MQALPVIPWLDSLQQKMAIAIVLALTPILQLIAIYPKQITLICDILENPAVTIPAKL